MEFLHLSTMATSFITFFSTYNMPKIQMTQFVQCILIVFQFICVLYTMKPLKLGLTSVCSNTTSFNSTTTHIEHPCPPIACHKWQWFTLCDRLHHTRGMPWLSNLQHTWHDQTLPKHLANHCQTTCASTSPPHLQLHWYIQNEIFCFIHSCCWF
jgi:hypothetical protein